MVLQTLRVRPLHPHLPTLLKQVPTVAHRLRTKSEIIDHYWCSNTSRIDRGSAFGLVVSLKEWGKILVDMIRLIRLISTTENGQCVTGHWAVKTAYNLSTNHRIFEILPH